MNIRDVFMFWLAYKYINTVDIWGDLRLIIITAGERVRGNINTSRLLVFSSRKHSQSYREALRLNDVKNPFDHIVLLDFWKMCDVIMLHCYIFSLNNMSTTWSKNIGGYDDSVGAWLRTFPQSFTADPECRDETMQGRIIKFYDHITYHI